MRLFPQTQVLKNSFNHAELVNQADDPHFSLAFGTNKRICFINFANEVGANQGSIVGVVIQPPAQNCCDASLQLRENKIYHPDEALRLPLPDCPQVLRCGCVYRPVMTYQDASTTEGSPSSAAPGNQQRPPRNPRQV
jgi:hypothetical protein